MKRNYAAGIPFERTRSLFFRKQFLSLLFSLLLSECLFSQLTMNVGVNAQELADSIVGPGYKIANASLKCPTNARATFTGTSTIGFQKGILLTTGDALAANGPNNNDKFGMNNGTPGDAQLDTLNGVNTFDGCALEFDLIPSCDTLRIKYVFGSEEYPEYVNKQFNDHFSIFLQGPGMNGAKNLACVPHTAIPVSINSINHLTNSHYYIDNTNGTTIQYDGFTTLLTARQHIIADSTYHLKIVIADVSDAIYDSGLFIEAGSINCDPSVGIAANPLEAFMQIYPNPANERLYISAPVNPNKNITVSLYSVIGELVYQENYINTGQSHQINTGEINSNGIHFLIIQSGDNSFSRKVHINH
jgi:hypothetical protein